MAEYSTEQLIKARDVLLSQANQDEQLTEWIELTTKLQLLLKEATVIEYHTILNKKLPVLYANNKQIQLLRSIELLIKAAQSGEAPVLNVHGMFTDGTI